MDVAGGMPATFLNLYLRNLALETAVAESVRQSMPSTATLVPPDNRGKLVRESLPWLLLDTRRAKKQGPVALAQRQRARLAEMVAFARAHSPYYRELYRDLSERTDDLTLLPITRKTELMARFDDWVTDSEVTVEKVRALVDDPDRIGERFLGRYIVATTSGTTAASR